MNAYADLTTLKSASYLNITATTHDTYLRKLLEQSSRLIDKYCNRYFYCYNGTKYFDGKQILFPKDDILSITTLQTDEDGDATFEITFTTGDYHLYPLNDYPKIRLEINPDGNYGSFASGIKKGVKIIGIFGYGDGLSATPYYSDTTTAEALDVAETAIDVISASNLSVGMTLLLVDSDSNKTNEQIYIQSIDSNTITVKRGVNGTTDDSHAITKQLYIYEYPQPIIQACLVMAMRAWKRKDSAFQDVVSIPEYGQLAVYKSVDPDVAETIKQYRKNRYA